MVLPVAVLVVRIVVAVVAFQVVSWAWLEVAGKQETIAAVEINLVVASL